MLSKIKVKLENCYGIAKFDHTFDFRNQQTVSIYAPNGSMKTSFARTFTDHKEGNDGKNPMYKHHERVCVIESEDGPLLPEQIVVIPPFEPEFKSQLMSNLLVDDTLRDEYDEIITELQRREDSLITALKRPTGVGGAQGLYQELKAIFGSDSALENLLAAREALTGFQDDLPAGVKYRQVFSSSLPKLLAKPGVQEGIDNYVATYNRISEESRYLTDGFTVNQLQKIAETIRDNGYFEAGHTITLTDNLDGSSTRTLTNSKELFEIIAAQRLQILGDAETLEAWAKVDKAFSTKDDQELRNLLAAQPEIRLRMADHAGLRREMMLSVIAEHAEILDEYLNYFKSVETRLAEIEEKANQERPLWEQVIRVFKERFDVPYTVELADQSSAVLERNVPGVKFRFFHPATGEEANPDREQLSKELSQGERRAMYLLDVIFDIEARRQAGVPCVYVVDDIADSFDYRNKYAIIEYLHDIANDPNTRLVILTHNFDFHRTVCSRFGLTERDRFSAYMVSRNAGVITLHEDPFQRDVFKAWRERIVSEPRIMIASIAYVRNLADYSGDNESKNLLTKLLHVKEGTKALTVADLEKIYRSVLKDKADLSLAEPDRNLYGLILDLAEDISQESDELNELETKVILAIATRLLAEEFMITAIGDDEFVASITSNQTRALFEKYKEVGDPSKLPILEKVNIMTPENIHLNAFMFEPILDMSNANLKAVYARVRDELK